nr:hypothetical protein [Tanacetum cinerariifolium]
SESERIIPEKGDLLDYWSDISTDRDFLGPPHSYTLIRDLVLRLYHRMMAHSIAGTRGPARKEADAGGVVEEALVAPGGSDKDEEMPQSVPPPPSTQGKRIARLEEEVHGMRKRAWFRNILTNYGAKLTASLASIIHK